MQINRYIDHTLLKPKATAEEIKKLCEEAKTYNFHTVCINGCYVKLASSLLAESEVKVCTVVGFPLGAMSTESKCFEAELAILNGADEIDMVINLGALVAGDFKEVQEDIEAVKNRIGSHTLKVIIESSELSDEQIKNAAEICVKAGADFVKTSTGFASGGASFEAVEIIKAAVKGMVKIKASGGIRDYATAKAYIDSGVSRLGVSAGVAIIKGENVNTDY